MCICQYQVVSYSLCVTLENLKIMSSSNERFSMTYDMLRCISVLELEKEITAYDSEYSSEFPFHLNSFFLLALNPNLENPTQFRIPYLSISTSSVFMRKTNNVLFIETSSFGQFTKVFQEVNCGQEMSI